MKLVLLFLAVIVFVEQAYGDARNHTSWADTHTHLYDHLMEGYNAAVRPAEHDGIPVNVSVGMTLVKIYGVNINTRSITLGLWFRVSWTDFRLSWNTSSYGGVNKLNMGSTKLWTPDLSLYNGLRQPQLAQNARLDDAILSSTGTILWIPHITVEAHCDLDVSDFPWDRHTCVLKYGSWVYNIKDLKFNSYMSTNFDTTSNLNPHPQWDIAASSFKLETKKYPCCPEGYQSLLFSVTLQRQNSYYAAIFITPAFIFTVLLALQFIMSRGLQRLLVEIGVIFGSFTMIMMLEFKLPSSAPNVPKIASNYMRLPILALVCIIINIILQGISNGTRVMPPILKQITSGVLAKLCCVPTPTLVYQAPNVGFTEMQNDLDLQDTKGSDICLDQQRHHVDTNSTDWIVLAHIFDGICFLLFAIIGIIMFAITFHH